MAESEPKAIYIEIRYDDGSKEYQTGEAAAEIWKWIMGAQAMYCIHGVAYRGPKLIMVKPEVSDGR
jgi:hypothetical protein